MTANFPLYLILKAKEEEQQIKSALKVETTVNINDYVWVKPTGYALTCIPVNELKQLVIDENGWVRFQLWQLMNIFGPHLFNGCQQLFHNNKIMFNA